MTTHLKQQQALHPFARELCAQYIPRSWTPEHVERRLVDALQMSMQLPNWRPQKFGNTWPKFRDEWSDLVFRHGSPDDPDIIRAARDARAPRQRLASEEISQMEEALGWVAQYIGDRRHIAVAVQIWIAGSLNGSHRGTIAVKRGLEPSHVKLLAQRGLRLTVAGLCSDQVAIR